MRVNVAAPAVSANKKRPGRLLVADRARPASPLGIFSPLSGQEQCELREGNYRSRARQTFVNRRGFA